MFENAVVSTSADYFQISLAFFRCTTVTICRWVIVLWWHSHITV